MLGQVNLSMIKYQKHDWHSAFGYKRLYYKQRYALKNWVDGVSDEEYYPWESPKKNQLKSVNATFASE